LASTRILDRNEEAAVDDEGNWNTWSNPTTVVATVALLISFANDVGWIWR